MSRHMIERTTVRLPEDLLARARRKARAENRTLTALIEDGLRVVLSDPHRPGSPIPCARISAATGGLMPEVDPVRLTDADDLEDIVRLRGRAG